jgi:hypothetical protein
MRDVDYRDIAPPTSSECLLWKVTLDVAPATLEVAESRVDGATSGLGGQRRTHDLGRSARWNVSAIHRTTYSTAWKAHVFSAYQVATHAVGTGVDPWIFAER